MSGSENSDLETISIRQAGLSIILHGLIDRMIARNLFTGADIAAIHRYALDMTVDLQNAAGPEARAAGVRIAEEVEAFLKVISIPPEDADNEEEA